MKCGECGNTLPPCDGFSKQVFCKRFHLHMGIYEDASRCRDFEKRPQTNADRIRAMTDEELANFVSLCCGWTCAECPVGRECNGDECFSTWLDWLKQEAQCTSE